MMNEETRRRRNGRCQATNETKGGRCWNGCETEDSFYCETHRDRKGGNDVGVDLESVGLAGDLETGQEKRNDERVINE